MSILVLTSCTASKVLHPGAGPIRAERLYAGQQHQRLMASVDAYRRAGEPAGRLELAIVSAGHGVLEGDQAIMSYNETFVGLTREAQRARAVALGIPAAIRELLAKPRGLALVLLGEDYLRAAALDDAVALGGPTIALTSPNAAKRLPRLDGLSVVRLHNREARRFACGLIGLKGELAARILRRLATTPEAALPTEEDAMLHWLDSAEPTGVSQLPLVAA
jgi:hypothetical protein